MADKGEDSIQQTNEGSNSEMNNNDMSSIMRRSLPSYARLTDAAEFIGIITNKANEKRLREQRESLAAEDLIWAMKRLGFDDRAESLDLYLQSYCESASAEKPIKEPSMNPPVEYGPMVTVPAPDVPIVHHENVPTPAASHGVYADPLGNQAESSTINAEEVLHFLNCEPQGDGANPNGGAGAEKDDTNE